MTKLLIVDDHQMFLEGLQSMLNHDDGFEVTLAKDAHSAWEAFEKTVFDVILMDIELTSLENPPSEAASMTSGVDLTKQFIMKRPDTRVLVVSMNKTAAAVDDLIAVGAKGYIIKDSGYIELKKGIKQVMKGEEYWDPKILQLMINARKMGIAKGQNELSAKMTDVVLTKRETEVLGLLAEGLTSKEMASELSVETSTIDTHRKNLIAKFGAKNSTDVVVKAKEQGLL